MNTHRSFRLTPSAGPITKLILKVGFIRILVVLLLAAAWGSYLAWDYDQTHGKKKAQHINCVNNLKQLGLAFRIWSGDNKDRYPCNVSTNDGGTMELCARDQDGFDRNGFLSLQVMSNELSVTMILVCPQDKGRHWATNFGSLRPETSATGFAPARILTRSTRAKSSRSARWTATFFTAMGVSR